MPKQKIKLSNNTGTPTSHPPSQPLSKKKKDSAQFWTTDSGTFSIQIGPPDDPQAPPSPFIGGETTFTGITKDNPADSSEVNPGVKSKTHYKYTIAHSAAKAVGDPDIVVED